MITKLVSKISPFLSLSKAAKKDCHRILKLKSSRTCIVIGSAVLCGYYLYEKDSDFIVDEFPRTLPVTLYRILPLCWFSRMIGKLSTKEIPVFLRKPILGSYVKLTGCDLSEAKVSEITEYKSLADLFQRQLKWDSRLIDRVSDLTSPCDGTVLYCGRADETGTIEQVKGVRFTLNGFLGSDFAVRQRESRLDGNALFFVTIYLGPGDYHRFHAPTEVQFSFRRYFPGRLLSVNPALARLVPGLFSVNERACYFGEWRYGLFAFTAVAATNVGDIRILRDPMLPSNEQKQRLDLIGRRQEGLALRLGPPVTWEKPLTPPIRLKRGELFGKFCLGSTIVLVFQAPMDFQLCVRPGDKVQMGAALGSVGLSDQSSLQSSPQAPLST